MTIDATRSSSGKPTAGQPTFDTALHGYDRGQVDAYVAQMQHALKMAQAPARVISLDDAAPVSPARRIMLAKTAAAETPAVSADRGRTADSRTAAALRDYLARHDGPAEHAFVDEVEDLLVRTTTTTRKRRR